MDDEAFYRWLRSKKGFTNRPARDVISRVRRVDRLIKIPKGSTAEKLISKLSQRSEFKVLTSSVKSQLKRAIRLLKEFEGKESR